MERSFGGWEGEILESLREDVLGRRLSNGHYQICTAKFYYSFRANWRETLGKNMQKVHFWLTRLQNSPYFCVFKYARAVKRGCEARALRARKTLTPRFTDFFTDF